MEELAVRVFAGGKVTVPKQLRVRFDVEYGNYVRLALVEVLKRGGARGEWVKRRVEKDLVQKAILEQEISCNKERAPSK